MTKRKPKSAADFLAELNADPESVARRSAAQDAAVLRDAEVASTLQPLLERLRASGYGVASIDDLASRYAPLPAKVVEVVLDWLRDAPTSPALDPVVRALGASTVEFSGEPLVWQYRNATSDELRYAVANTMAQARVQGIESWLVNALRRERGVARQPLALAVARHVPREEANTALLDVLDEMPGHAALALSECGGAKELQRLERKYDELSGWERQEVGRAISVIQRRLSEGGR